MKLQYFILKICIIIVKVVKPCAGLGYEQHQCASFVYHLCTMMNSAQLGYGWTHWVSKDVSKVEN